MPAAAALPAAPALRDPAAVGAFFREHGFYLAKGLYGGAQLEEAERDFDRIVRQLHASSEQVDVRWQGEETERLGAGTFITHTHQVQCYSAAWLRMFLEPRFLDVAEAILGPDIVLHHSKLFQKPPEKGAPFPAHQDWQYFPTTSDEMIAAVIHVSQASDEMGCVRVFPGSHKLGRIANSMGQGKAGDFAQRFRIEDGVPVEAEPGDVLFFHYFTVHGSLTNRSPRTRKTVLTQLYSGRDEMEHAKGHVNSRLVLRGWNHRMTRTRADG